MNYTSLDKYLKSEYGEKVLKVSLSGGMTCPNRDGTLGIRGCIFCSRGGSGDFAESAELSVTEQIENGKQRISAKSKNCRYFIAYFQSFTNTYAPINYLRKLFTEAILHPDIVILSIATRPDCLSEEVLDLLSELNKIKPVWVELGLQTTHAKTAEFIRRGYELSVYDKAVRDLNKRGIKVITHVILGLPMENREQMLETVKYIAESGAWGIKLQLLHVLKDTDLADYYEEQKEKGFPDFHIMTLDEYSDLVVDCLKLIPPNMTVHRITGDGPKRTLVAPLWSADKKTVLNTLNKKIKNT